MRENEIGTRITEAAIAVHRELGPGFLETVYEVILELKSVEHVSTVHRKQMQTYLRLSGCKLGYLLNFGEDVMKTGIARCVNGLEE